MINFENIIAFIAGLIGFLTIISATLVSLFQFKEGIKKTSERITQAELRVEAQPEKIKPAWDLARVTLESYFNRNLSQVSAIFWLSVGVMVIGFFIVIWGIWQAIQLPNSTLPAVITGLAGVITELIGATFILIYRSTMEQAVTYTKTLERINSVGMAMQILDTIPNNATESGIKNSTKAAVVKMLMEQAYKIEDPTNLADSSMKP
jgi:predicted PurR-regulated permease PerM